MFEDILLDIESVFASSTWKTNNIATYPDNYQGVISNPDEFCRISVLTGSGQTYAYGAKKQITGAVIVRIFVKAGNGQKKIMEIADKLDAVLQYKKLTNGTELGTSFVSVEGLDQANNTLYSARYTISFTLYGD